MSHFSEVQYLARLRRKQAARIWMNANLLFNTAVSNLDHFYLSQEARHKRLIIRYYNFAPETIDASSVVWPTQRCRGALHRQRCATQFARGASRKSAVLCATEYLNTRHGTNPRLRTSTLATSVCVSTSDTPLPETLLVVPSRALLANKYCGLAPPLVTHSLNPT